jgi:hypothetical protein
MNPSLAIGARVTLNSIPSEVLSDWNKFPETTALFHHAQRRSFTVRGLNEYNMVELWLNDDGSEDTTGTKHSIWVEPEYLEASTAME